MRNDIFEVVIADYVYQVEVRLVVGENRAVNKEFKKRFDLEDEEFLIVGERGCSIVLHNKGERKYHVWMEKYDSRFSEIATLAHEVSHLVDQIFEIIGVKEVDTEMRAYYIGFWMFAMLSELDKYLDKKEKKEKRKKKKNEEPKV